MIAAPHERPKLSEKQFMAQVVRYARLMGWRCFHAFDSRRSEPGLPDLLLLRRPRLLFVELKSQRGTLTDAQYATLIELRACGQETHFWRPDDWPKIERILR